MDVLDEIFIGKWLDADELNIAGYFFSSFFMGSRFFEIPGSFKGSTIIFSRLYPISFVLIKFIWERMMNVQVIKAIEAENCVTTNIFLKEERSPFVFSPFNTRTG